MELRPYQADAVRFLTERRRALLALPPGAGKTAIVAKALPAGRCLIVCPNGPVLHHWCSELLTWGTRVSLVGTGTKIQRHRARTFGRGDLIINYECFWRDIEELVQYEWDCVVFDESHRLKNRQSMAFKAAKKLQTEHLYLVSGTPVLNRATELWTSLHLMDPKKYRSFWRWAESFFTITTPRYGRRIVREVGAIKSPEHAAILRKDLHVRMFYRPISEILPDLPPTIETTYTVALSDEEQKAHDSMVDHFWMEVGDDIVQVENAVAKMTRLRQLASDWSVFGEAPGTKSQVAAQLVDELDGEPVLIFVAFRQTADALVSILPNAAAYHGGKGDETRRLTLAAFKGGQVKQLVATIKSIGEATDGLQHVTRNVIMLDRDWTPARNEQAIGRVGGARAKQAVNVIHIVAEGSVDETVNDALREKRDVVSAVIETRGANHAVH
jgi:SNF2 family DNA or RNA helicase